MIWILTAGFGDGHNTAARSVAEALTRLLPDEKVEATDLISDVMPRLSTVLKAAYQAAIIHWPAAWRLTYKIVGSPNQAPAPRKMMPSGTIAKLNLCASRNRRMGS